MAYRVSEFEGGLDVWIESEIPAEVVKTQKALAFDIYAALTEGWPVLTGRSRASWTMQAGSPNEAVIPEGLGTKENPIPPPQPPPLALIPALDKLTVVWLNNQLPYAERLEEGWSQQQAPNGVLNVILSGIAAEGA